MLDTKCIRILIVLSQLFFPSRAEQTSEYAPPEALLNSTWYHGPTSTILKYVILLLMLYLILVGIPCYMWVMHHLFFSFLPFKPTILQAQTKVRNLKVKIV